MVDIKNEIDEDGVVKVIHVIWSNGNKGKYRHGYNGRMYLECVKQSHGTDCYQEHLSQLGKNKKTMIMSKQHCMPYWTWKPLLIV